MLAILLSWRYLHATSETETQPGHATREGVGPTKRPALLNIESLCDFFAIAIRAAILSINGDEGASAWLGLATSSAFIKLLFNFIDE